MNYFEPLNTPLTGTNLVEASAGTGKTYAIASLYVRLLLEESLAVREILVVTFTRAATEELKSRIRERIRDGLRAISGVPTDDPFLKGLCLASEDALRARHVLTVALRSFDEAAIFTIHGFCLRMLRDHAFESGSLFDTELAQDQRQVFAAMVNDFWRIRFYGASPLFLNYAFTKTSQAGLANLSRLYAGNPLLFIKTGRQGGEEDYPLSTERETLSIFDEAARAWEESRDVIVSSLLKANLNAKKGVRSRKPIDELAGDLDIYFATGYPLPMPERFDLLCHEVPHEPFLSLCSKLRKAALKLADSYDLLITDLTMAAAEYARIEGANRNGERNVRSFDDLLLDLYGALKGEGGKGLASSIGRKYRAVLVDEFQDTDPVQYEIFKSIYSRSKAVFFVIGDPKQSIYSFRGADIFAYIKAKQEIPQQYTLGYNWRSSSLLVKAVNAIFRNVPRPFVFDHLEFYPVEAAVQGNQRDFTINGLPDPAPLKLWFMKRRENKKNITMGEARDLLCGAVSGEIVRLLAGGRSGEVRIGERPFVPGDIAVLVRTNREARDMQRALKNVNVPGVIYSDESVFSTAEAMETGRLLEALARPGDEAKVKAALTTDLMGVSGNTLALMIENENVWDGILEKFQFYNQKWLNKGFIAMVRTFVSRERTKQHLLGFPDGERRLTNFLHCVELLHDASVKNKLNIEGLLEWFAGKREKGEASEAEEHEIRLETDEMAVKLVTIHRSKGLQYPVVFCPFGWAPSETGRNRLLTYHDVENDYRPTIDVSSDSGGRGRSLAGKEQLAENVRLLYVALTRARYRCYVAWGYVNKSETSALAYLLHQRSSPLKEPLLESLAAIMAPLTDEKMEADVKELVRDSGGSIQFMPVPGPEGLSFVSPDTEVPLGSCREFSGGIRKDWRVSSFTSLISGREGTADLPDRDRGYGKTPPLSHREGKPEETGPPTILDFPRGSQPGSCLHEVFQELDFSFADPEAVRGGVRDTLARYGFEDRWCEPVFQMVARVLSVPLPGNGESFALSQLRREERLHEMEFYFPLKLITSRKLSQVFAAHGGGLGEAGSNTSLESLGFTPVRGMLKGYMDLVFIHGGRYYIIDWKSNFLGSGAEEYNLTRLREVMEEEYYVLQYHLYVVALHKYLSRRVKGYCYDTHFGGVFYLFVRGIDPRLGSSCGIFADRPGEDLIDALSLYLTGV